MDNRIDIWKKDLNKEVVKGRKKGAEWRKERWKETM